MQFGRIHGIALIVLGIVLLGVQAVISFTPKQLNIPAESSSRTIEHKSTSVPGIIGAASLVIGVTLFFTAYRRDEPPAERAVK